jgi:hypothetical protein
MGFSPKPSPRLIATFPTKGPAVAISRGLDRDRVVDETGNQTVVFGRRGSRPFNLDEMSAFLRHFSGPAPADPKAPRRGPLNLVEDTAMKDGALKTKSGASLKEPQPFKPLPEVATQPPPSERLVRRGK